MNKRHLIMLCVTPLAVALIISIGGGQLAQARSRLHAAQDALVSLKRDAQEIIDLRTRQQVVNVAERPAQDVIALINATLNEIGIPTNRLTSLTPESDTALASSGNATGSSTPSGGYRQQALRLTVENLTVEEIGSFLIQWRSTQKVWTPIRIELTHVRNSNKDNSGENRYDASIVLSAVYLAQS
jgi:hypothetical protein